MKTLKWAFKLKKFPMLSMDYFMEHSWKLTEPENS